MRLELARVMIFSDSTTPGTLWHWNNNSSQYISVNDTADDNDGYDSNNDDVLTFQQWKFCTQLTHRCIKPSKELYSIVSSALFLVTIFLHFLYNPPTSIGCRFFRFAQPLPPTVSAPLLLQSGTVELNSLLVFALIRHHTVIDIPPSYPLFHAFSSS